MFEVGQVVRSRVNAQGLVLGNEYRVQRTFEVRQGFCGYTVTVVEAPSGETYQVVNGHFVLEPAS